MIDLKALWKWLDKAAPNKKKKNISLNSKLYNDLQECFTENLEKLSVGERMLYPMSFTILMHQSDYEEIKESLGYVLSETVRRFYRIIDKYQTEFPNYIPPAMYWFFNISGSKLDRIPIANGQYLEIHKGEFTPIAHLYSHNFDNRQDNVRESQDLRVSVRIRNSDVYSNVNLNPEVLKDFETLADGVFKIPFNKSLPNNAQEILEDSNITEINGLAELSYSRFGKTVYFTMRDKLIHISGKNEQRKGGSFFILNSENIKDSHVQIKYVANEKKFQLAAYGPTRLNARKVIESNGGNIVWYDLSNNSTIFINDEISVKFTIK